MDLGLIHLSIVTVAVVIDNALLAGILMPRTVRDVRVFIACTVGLVMAVAQVLLAFGVHEALHVAWFRLIVLCLLVMMCVKTVMETRLETRASVGYGAVMRVAVYTCVGNLDNMIWLGMTVGPHHLLLLALSVISVPLFITVVLFLASQRDRHAWVAMLGAGMMAWAAATLVLGTPDMWIITMPPFYFHVMFTAALLTIGWTARRLAHRLSV